MGCKGFGVDMILVGLYSVGIVGLCDAFAKADESGVTDPEATLGLLVDSLRADNYVPDAQVDAFRTAIWREYLRYRGEDFTEFFSEVDVTVRGDAGEARDRFVELTHSVLGDFELRPVITVESEDTPDSRPELIINDETVVRGSQSRASFKTAVRKSISHW